MRIEQEDPLLYKAINKNEAHIRFMNSIWYARRIIQIVAFLTMAVCIGILAPYMLAKQGGPAGIIPIVLGNIALNISMQRILCVLALSFVYAVACLYIRHSVKEILHYQRVRELNMILEALKIIAERKIARC
jgi:hypothetical protein